MNGQTTHTHSNIRTFAASLDCCLQLLAIFSQSSGVLAQYGNMAMWLLVVNAQTTRTHSHKYKDVCREFLWLGCTPNIFVKVIDSLSGDVSLLLDSIIVIGRDDRSGLQIDGFLIFLKIFYFCIVLSSL